MKLMQQALTLLLLAPLLSCGADSDYEPRDGDLIFQTSRSEQSRAIQLATHSPFSHVGIVYVKNGSPFVFEAAGPVVSTPLSQWIEGGEGGAYVVKRLREAEELLTAANLTRMMEVAERFRGKPYDPYFEWSDTRIYCSELVWKIYERALGITLGEPQTLGSFDLSAAEVREKMQERWGDSPPMGEQVISPAAVFDSDKLTEVYRQAPH